MIMSQCSKIAEILNCFTRQDWTDFRLYIESPFFGDRAVLRGIFYAISKPRIDQAVNMPTKEKIWKKVYGNEKYKPRRLENQLSEFIKALEQYLSYTAHIEEHILHEVNLFRAYNERRSQVLAIQQAKKIQAKLTNGAAQDSHFWLEQYEFEWERDNLLGNVAKHADLDNILLSFNHHFLIRQLSNYCLFFSRTRGMSVKLGKAYWDKFERFLQLFDLKDTPIVKLYIDLLALLQNPADLSRYKKLKEKTTQDEYEGIFRSVDGKQMISLLNNYCVQQSNNGDESFLEEMHYWNKVMIDRNLIYDERGYVNEKRFKNIISIASRLKKVDFLEDFLLKVKNRMASSKKKYAYPMGQAALFLLKGEPEKGIELLKELKCKQPNIKIGLDHLLLKCCYDAKDVDLFEVVNARLRRIVRDNKNISEGAKKHFLSVLTFTRRLFRTPSHDKKEIKKLQKYLEITMLSDKRWLIEKLAEKKKKP